MTKQFFVKIKADSARAEFDLSLAQTDSSFEDLKKRTRDWLRSRRKKLAFWRSRPFTDEEIESKIRMHFKGMHDWYQEKLLELKYKATLSMEPTGFNELYLTKDEMELHYGDWKGTYELMFKRFVRDHQKSTEPAI